MLVKAIYENGVLIPKEKLNLKEHQSVFLNFWSEIKEEKEIENAYAEASKERDDLKEWDSLDTEGWPDV